MRNLILSHSLDIFQGFFGSCKGLVGSQFDLLGEPFDTFNGLLNRFELSADFIEIFLLEKSIARGSLEKQEKLHN